MSVDDELQPWYDIIREKVTPETCPDLNEIKDILSAMVEDDYENEFYIQDLQRCLDRIEIIREANYKLRLALASSYRYIETVEQDLEDTGVQVDSHFCEQEDRRDSEEDL